MGVVEAGAGWVFDFEGEEKGFGFIEGGERSRRIVAWTWDRVVVTAARPSAVIPDHLHDNYRLLENKEGNNEDKGTKNLVR